MKLLGFDFGTKRIGVASGETITCTAQPLETVPAKDGIPNWDDITNIIKEWQPEKLIVGLPLKNDGTELHTTNRAKKFANRLHEKTKLPVIMQNENYSTVEAKSQAFETGGFRKLQKAQIDSLAACIILEDWMNDNV